MVSIHQIKGSGGRRYDFDNNFNPLRHHNRQRWLRIAQACQRGAASQWPGPWAEGRSKPR
jgi:hypothetical protein